MEDAARRKTTRRPVIVQSVRGKGWRAAVMRGLKWATTRGARNLALRRGHCPKAGREIRVAEFLSGPLALILRATGLVPAAALSFLCGALLSRFGWLEAGRVSGADPEAVFASQQKPVN